MIYVLYDVMCFYMIYRFLYDCMCFSFFELLFKYFLNSFQQMSKIILESPLPEIKSGLLVSVGHKIPIPHP